MIGLKQVLTAGPEPASVRTDAAAGDLPAEAVLEVKETYDAHFSGDLSTGDVEALKRRAQNVNRDGFSVFIPVPAADADVLDRPASPGWAETTYHVVRLTAQSQAHARRQVIDALQREPDNLTLRRAPEVR